MQEQKSYEKFKKESKVETDSRNYINIIAQSFQ